MPTKNPTNVRVRIAPSPTGFVHIGTLRTVLYNYLFAKRYNGIFIARIEDTDRTRLVPGAVEDLLQILHDTGLTADEGLYLDDNLQIKEKGDCGPYFQSQRLEIYHKHIQDLLEKNKAYYCFCTKERLDNLREQQKNEKKPPKYDGLCRDLDKKEIQSRLDKNMPHVIRFKMPADKPVIFNDLIRGAISINTDDLDDLVLIKSDGYPTYHFANIVDDHLMKITHVLRGEEWIASTPKHILMYEAFGWHAPQYAHLPQLLNKDKKKMSKRQGDVAVKDFLSNGYLRDALLNFIVLLGWNSGTDQEIYSLDEMVKQFSMEKVHKAGAVFDLDKLDWLNGVYIRGLSIDKFTEQCLPFLTQAKLITCKNGNWLNTQTKESIDMHWLKTVCALEQPRIKKLADLPEAINYFFQKQVKLVKKNIVWKKSTLAKSLSALKDLIEAMSSIQENDFSKDNLEVIIKKMIEQKSYSNGDVLWPLRYSLSGREQSPGPFELAAALGKKKSIERLNQALKNISPAVSRTKKVKQ